MQAPPPRQVVTVPLLVSARVVCAADDRLAGMQHVPQLISDFLDRSMFWSLENASRRVLPFLLHRLAQREPSVQYVDAQCDQCHAFAACDGRIAEMITLDALFPHLIISEAVAAAASSGQLAVLTWLYSRRAPVCWRPDIAQLGVASGVLSVARFLLERFPVTSLEAVHNMLLISVARGFDDIIAIIWPQFVQLNPSENDLTGLLSRTTKTAARKMLRDPSVISPAISIDTAARRGDLPFVLWAHTRHPVATVKAMDSAATHGHLAMVRWLHHNRLEGCTTEAIDGASAHGHFEVVRWLYENRSEGCTDQALFAAAFRGHLDIAAWLFEKELGTFPPNTFDHVCANGHLEVAKWLTANRLGGGSVNAMDWAAAQNHLSVVEWLHAGRPEGCTTAAVDAAACHGHLDVVRFLLEHRSEGCTTDAFDHAAGNGHFHVLRWLDTSNSMVGFTTAAMDNAAAIGRLDIIQWLHAHQSAVGCTTAAMDNAASRGKIAIVEWLHLHRAEGGTSRGVDRAAMNGHKNVVAFFFRYRRERVSEAAFRVCVRRGDLHTARWIAALFGDAADMEIVIEYAPSKGWTNAILTAAFSLGHPD